MSWPPLTARWPVPSTPRRGVNQMLHALHHLVIVAVHFLDWWT
jgi:hypothetical protein